MKTLLKWISITLVLLFVSIRIAFYFSPKPTLLNELSFSQAVFDEHKHLLRLTLSQDAKYRFYTPLSDMPPQLIAATLLQEDQYFRWHGGVNPFSLAKAIWQTYVTKSRRIGASTISMQVARMRFGIRSKTFSGKCWQIIRAWQLEAHYTKDQLLEAYLNMAPYGNNIEGVGAASLIYFGKTVNELALPEALTLAIIPQNPSQRTPHHEALKNIRYKLFTRWLAKHPEDANKKVLMELPLQMRSIHYVPFLAPHFTNEVLSAMPSNQHQLVTTLDLGLQEIIEKVTHRYLMRKATLGVDNVSVLLVDSRDMTIKAMLGSADFFNQKIGGQINGTAINRSPGSTLKPFIYALALDQGLIHPATVLKDVPHSFGSYNPENFDNDFIGPIKAKDALISSRNIPAIYLADQLKHPSLYEFLQNAGIIHLKPESYYGLALVLGGAEMNMQELVALYATLANNGIWQPLRYSKNISSHSNKKLLSKEASFLVVDMLKETQLPGTHYGMTHDKTMQIAWKTGTSSGFRDAWTIGLFGPYVMAVWIGHFNNQSNTAFVGKEIAAPLFFEIANAINMQYGPLVDRQPSPKELNLVKTEVCKASGQLPTRNCFDTEKVWFIPGKSPIKTDTIHREIAIDSKTGLRTCHINKQTRFEIYEFWPSDLLKIFKQAGIQRRVPPPYTSDCALNTKKIEGLNPQIVSPQTGVKYISRIHTTTPILIPLTAVVDADVRSLYWFLNESYLGQTTRDQSYLWRAIPGHYVIRVVDEYGRSDAKEVKVELES